MMDSSLLDDTGSRGHCARGLDSEYMFDIVLKKVKSSDKI